jgi:glycosyltransferase involved in cell wall biosynthesis
MASAGDVCCPASPFLNLMSQAPRKVLLVSNKMFHYRVANYNYFAKRLRELGWEFIVRASEIEANNAIPVEFDCQVMPFGFGDYKREIERIQPDVVIFFIHLKDRMIWPLMHWLKWRGTPFVYWNKGINLEVKNPWFRNQFFYYVHNLSSALILYSKHNVKDIKPKNRSKVFIAHNTVNFTSFPAIAESKEDLKKEFDIPFKKVVLFVGRMREVKKVEHLIEIFNGLNEPDTGCVIVGDPMSYNIPSLIKSPNIKFLGEVHDPQNLKISKLFKMSDLFCIPGDVGLGLNQAFYWGLPVLTEDGFQPPEIHNLVNGRNGFMVAENDHAALKEKLLLLLRDDKLRAEFSRNASEDIRREATIETMFSGFRDCLAMLEAKGLVRSANA